MATQQPSGDKSGAIYRELWSRVRDGRWPPGARVPGRHELAAEFDTSLATLQKAMAELIRQGFVRPRGRRGTFVVSRMPAERVVALGFGGTRQAGQHWSTMWQALEARAEAINEQGRRGVRLYHGLIDDGGDVARLEQDCVAGSVGGVFIVGMPMQKLVGSPILTTPGLPCVAVTSTPVAGVERVRIAPLIGRALDYLGQRGRRRIALIDTGLQAGVEAQWRGSLQARGLMFHPFHVVLVDPAEPEPAAVAAYHMAQQPASRRPDAFVITDDSLVEAVTRGLAASGTTPRRGMDVLAHCNFPLLPTAAVPVTYLGYDLGDLLDRVVERFLPEHRTPATGPIRLEPRFDHEIPSRRRELLATVDAQRSRRRPAQDAASLGAAPLFGSQE